jgi:hypothetical protein
MKTQANAVTTVVKNAAGDVLPDTAAGNAEESLTLLLKNHRMTWAFAQADGYNLEEIVAFPVPTTAAAWNLLSESAAKHIGEQLLHKLALVSLREQAGEALQQIAESIRDEMYEVMKRFTDAGATNSTPEAVLVETISSCLSISLSR